MGSHHISSACPVAGAEAGDEDLSEEEKVRQVEEAHLAESMERLIMEAYKLLQQGDMQQAESLLQEGVSHQAVFGHVCKAMMAAYLHIFATVTSVAGVRHCLTHVHHWGVHRRDQGGGKGETLALSSFSGIMTTMIMSITHISAACAFITRERQLSSPRQQVAQTLRSSSAQQPLSAHPGVVRGFRLRSY